MSFNWASDLLDHPTYQNLVRTNKQILSSTKSSPDPLAQKLYRDAKQDAEATLSAMFNSVNDLRELGKQACGSTKCDPNVKSRCMRAICDLNEWETMLKQFAQYLRTDSWRGMSNDKTKAYSPMTIEDLVELRITMRRNGELFRTSEQGIETILKSMDKSLLQKFKRQFKNVRGSEESHLVTALTICLVIMLVLAMLHLFNQIWQSHKKSEQSIQTMQGKGWEYWQPIKHT